MKEKESTSNEFIIGPLLAIIFMLTIVVIYQYYENQHLTSVLYICTGLNRIDFPDGENLFEGVWWRYNKCLDRNLVYVHNLTRCEQQLLEPNNSNTSIIMQHYKTWFSESDGYIENTTTPNITYNNEHQIEIWK
jgi:hypothetical protein